jgi:UDP-N-acetylmuramyl pentapeptide phosphotransferase/UDP-N-acetylglucosamine-1-phosphate transferase
MEFIVTGSNVRLILLFGLAAVISAVLIVLLRPFMQRYALARPNARSSHTIPTPQGGGIAVIAGIVLAIGLAAYLEPAMGIDLFPLGAVLVTAALLAVVGAIDDIVVLEVIPRLIFQALAVAAIILVLPEDLRVFSALPWWLERCLLVVGGIWFVNLVNFMDGLDWMTVAEVVPLTAALALFGLMDALPWDATIIAFALCGAILGFAPFNRPVARLFLGDVGSLPIGLLLGWLLIMFAGYGHLAAALLLPLYYVADTTITLGRRLVSGEQVLQAHRSHFYQRALDGGFTVYQIVGQVFGTNIILAGLAAATLMNVSWMLHVIALVVGSTLVTALLWNFNRGLR